MPSTSDPREVDRAALLGAALAAVVALAFAGEGEWDWLATLSGGALLAIIVAFFRLPGAGARRHAELVALAAVVGLCAALALAAPLQAVLSATPAATPCRGAAALAAAQARATDPGVGADVLAVAAEERGSAAFGGCIGAGDDQGAVDPGAGGRRWGGRRRGAAAAPAGGAGRRT